MLVTCARRLALLILLAVGCSNPGKRQPPAPNQPLIGRGTPATPKPLAIDRPISPARQNNQVDDRELLIPPPPKLTELTTKPPAEPKALDPDVKPAAATDVKPPPLLLVSNDEPKPEPAKQVGDESLATLKQIYQRAAATYAKMDAFEARLTRRETINGHANPQEVIRFQFRKQPYSVRLKWIGGDRDNVGREVIYMQKSAASKMHILPSKADSFPLPPMRMSFAPDDAMVRSKTRHDIRAAGFGEAIKRLGVVLAAIDKSPAQRNRLKYLGQLQRDEYPTKLHAIEETVAPRTESLLPQGGKRYTYYDTSDAVTGGLPVLVVTFDAAGKEVEYYCFDRFLFPVRLDDSDFDPDRAWKK